jgi:predicted dehydrogenase
MVRIALVGLGKMGLSHLAIAQAHPRVELVAICDTANYVAEVLNKYTGVHVYSSFDKLLSEETLDAVIIATPSRMHASMVRAALVRGLHVFCEKPFCLNALEGTHLAELAEQKHLVGQVGYHFRFVGAFAEARRLIDLGALGRIHHVRAEAYGPVVLRTKSATWRAKQNEGGGCLFDYACHAVDIVGYLVGYPERVEGTILNKIFSNDVDDEVYSNFRFANGATGQLACNWSDDSYRKMSVRVTVWGTNGHISVDRQELRRYLRDAVKSESTAGWSTSYTTDLSPNVDYYLRGEEYSVQIDHFVECIETARTEPLSSFRSAAETDRVVAQIRDAANVNQSTPSLPSLRLRPRAISPRRGFLGRAFRFGI